MMTKQQFEVMEQSLQDATVNMPVDTGISVALWRLQALMSGYRWAVTHGMLDKNHEGTNGD
jgi:hypothetical protein